ncbi:hypothetical protein FIBSPDRAFT_851506 [Athelia psychrophila]|uniref:Cysteine-rich protein n=1 Tax=Athelia psychrophila TaxID=1759441 RepID=A0A166SJC5_9AGAM|nr:hypothetical protein FIBSPDRAFT_878987 [Fibularhizoctonia sp. CBS 109695]KZP29515.1 hypothetical protein FIBSPDRAFT_851506 [Fibularhizoctonia sp. CBS 109695]
MRFTPVALLAIAAAATPVLGGPLAYAMCQTGCNGLAVACYSGAGFIMGTTIVGGPPAIIACNLGLGTCMATCATVALFAPTP